MNFTEIEGRSEAIIGIQRDTDRTDPVANGRYARNGPHLVVLERLDALELVVVEAAVAYVGRRRLVPKGRITREILKRRIWIKLFFTSSGLDDA